MNAGSLIRSSCWRPAFSLLPSPCQAATNVLIGRCGPGVTSQGHPVQLLVAFQLKVTRSDKRHRHGVPG